MSSENGPSIDPESHNFSLKEALKHRPSLWRSWRVRNPYSTRRRKAAVQCSKCLFTELLANGESGDSAPPSGESVYEALPVAEQELMVRYGIEVLLNLAWYDYELKCLRRRRSSVKWVIALFTGVLILAVPFAPVIVEETAKLQDAMLALAGLVLSIFLGLRLLLSLDDKEKHLAECWRAKSELMRVKTALVEDWGMGQFLGEEHRLSPVFAEQIAADIDLAREVARAEQEIYFTNLRPATALVDDLIGMIRGNRKELSETSGRIAELRKRRDEEIDKPRHPVSAGSPRSRSMIEPVGGFSIQMFVPYEAGNKGDDNLDLGTEGMKQMETHRLGPLVRKLNLQTEIHLEDGPVKLHGYHGEVNLAWFKKRVELAAKLMAPQTRPVLLIGFHGHGAERTRVVDPMAWKLHKEGGSAQISAQDIVEILSVVPEGVRVVILNDCCYAGDGIPTGPGGVNGVVLNACPATEETAYNPTGGGSYFIEKLCRQLDGTRHTSYDSLQQRMGRHLATHAPRTFTTPQFQSNGDPVFWLQAPAKIA